MTDIDARHREQLLAGVESPLVSICRITMPFSLPVRYHLGNRNVLVVVLHGGEAEAADAHLREPAPADGLREQLRRFNAREDNAIGAGNSSERGDEVVLHVGHAGKNRQAAQSGHAADVLLGFDAEAAVLAVEIGVVESGGFEDAGDLGSRSCP
jgi:hypothetical protein